MTEKRAFELVQAMHEQNGDSSFYELQDELSGTFKKDKTFKDWFWTQQCRTDLSQDWKWEFLECFDASLEIVWNLLNPEIKTQESENK